jgi:hypothetical protein
VPSPTGAGVAAAAEKPKQAIVDFTGTRAAGDTADFVVHQMPVSLQSLILNFDTLTPDQEAQFLTTLVGSCFSVSPICLR